MLNHYQIKRLIARLDCEGLLELEADEEETGWEVVRIESVEEHHVSYGFRSTYNGLIVGGLPSLELADAVKEHKMVNSYVEKELMRQLC